MTIIQFKIGATIVMVIALLCGAAAIASQVVREDSLLARIIQVFLTICGVFFSICAVGVFGLLMYDFWIK